MPYSAGPHWPWLLSGLGRSLPTLAPQAELLPLGSMPSSLLPCSKRDLPFVTQDGGSVGSSERSGEALTPPHTPLPLGHISSLLYRSGWQLTAPCWAADTVTTPRPTDMSQLSSPRRSVKEGVPHP